jgi:hypothetical protein
MRIAFVDSLGGEATFVDRVTAEISPDAELAGELLLFKDAVLCRAEVNSNNDEFDEESLHDLAETLPMMPVDDAHREQSIVGVFTGAGVSDGALLTAGLVYAKRFPLIARGIIAGDLKLSVEAEIGQATCSVCNGVFANKREYCSHLNNKLSGARRKIGHPKAIGGGVTPRPAGTGTSFDRTQLAFATSAEEADGVLSVHSVEPEENMEELEMLKAEVARLSAALATSETALTASTLRNDELAASLADAEKVYTRSLMLVRANFSDAEIAAIRPDLATASDTVIELLIAGKNATAPAVVETAVETVVAADQTAQPQGQQVLGDAAKTLAASVLTWDAALFA